MNDTVEALVEGSREDGFVVKSPLVGIYGGCPRVGGRRAGGDTVGTIRVLDRREGLLLPAGVDGMVAEVAIHDLEEAVEYGQTLFRLTATASDEAEKIIRHASGKRTGAGLPEGCHAVTCPIDGVFYRRSSPSSAPFVEVGARVEAGRTLGLIEAMKSFNAVVYGGPGMPSPAEIVEIRVEDASETRQGGILFVVRPA